MDPNVILASWTFIDAEKIDLSVVGGVEVSTVRLPKFRKNEPDVFETCLFDAFNPMNNSRVVARYDDRAEAARTHRAIVEALSYAKEADPNEYGPDVSD